jgi:fibro-slime domain-containing protein
MSCVNIRREVLALPLTLALALSLLFFAAPSRAADAVLPDHAIVPGFNRIYGDAESGDTNADAELVRGGLLLLGELNCTSCHKTEQAAALEQISVKQAPLLGDVGSRVSPDWIARFLADPQAVKAGSTMPHVLAGLEPAARAAAVERLTHFLASQASRPFVISGPEGSAVAQGEVLFHSAGCIACHAPRRNLTDELARTSVPLGTLEDKYSIGSLTAFLNDPLQVRPAGRMPHLPLGENQASYIAQYLLKETKAPAALNVAYYEDNVHALPDVSKLKPKSTGNASSFDISGAARKDNFGFNFTGYLAIDKEGEYTFSTKSDDGSWLYVNEQLVVDNGGTHPATEKSGRIELAPGRYPIRLTYLQGGGEYSLEVRYEGPGVKRGPIPSALLTSTKEPPPEQKKFEIDASLASEGRQLFGALGCAACHRMGAGREEIVSVAKAPLLAQLKPEGGCLSQESATGRPLYTLSSQQSQALAVAIAAVSAGKFPTWEANDRVHAKFSALNCYACHRRGEVGGVTNARNPYFTANDKDLGDEGRLPPTLTGVGDKLKSQWLAKVLTKAGAARPYMDARMPQFGEENLANIDEDLTKLDLHAPSAPQSSVPLKEAKEAGHRLVGKQGLSCISCHMFYRHKSSGIQATDLSMMPERLRADWFHRYMQNPQLFRPGTRMPQAWPDGKSMRKEILAGHTDEQIDAIYAYLSDGRRAILPEGVVVTSMELIVGGEAILYRNFIEGAGSRAIGVGYTEEVNLAFDANELRLALLWQGRFMDASRHWTGRGVGFEKPLGEKVVNLIAGPPLALLESTGSPWPTVVGHAAGYRFEGYELDKLRRPTFFYRFGDVEVSDLPLPKEDGIAKSLVRTLSFEADNPPSMLYLRVAGGGEIERIDDTTFRLAEKMLVKIESDAKPLLRETNGGELLVPITFKAGRATLAIEYAW